MCVMDLNEKPTSLLESELDQEIATSDSGELKKLYRDDEIDFAAMDKDVHVKMEEGGYSEHGVEDKDNRLLQSKINELEFQTVELGREVKVLRERNEELELRIASIEKDREVKSEIWKQKCKELESRLLALQRHSSFTFMGEKEELVNGGNTLAAVVNKVIQDGGMRCVMTPDEPVNYKNGIEVIDLDGVGYSSPSRKRLFCGDDGNNSEKTAPCTPVGARPRPTFTIDAIDANDKHHISTADVVPSGTQGYNVLTPFASKESAPYSKASTTMVEGDEDMSDCNEKISFVVIPKRKRSLKVFTSDTESDDDDNIPIGQLVRNNIQPLVPQPAVSDSDADSDLSTRRRHRLVKLSQYKGRKKTPETDDSENDDDDDDDDNLGNFIVCSSDDLESEEEGSDVEQEFSDESSEDFDGILHKVKRTKDHGSKWELEGDMLAAFGKDPILCMKAVCALFRQQTCDEQEVRGTFVSNGRGFSKFDALRGTQLAVLLTDGNPNGDVTKSVEQLNEFDPNGVEKCRTLATRYSKQLFEIYQNGEDPHFFSSSHLDSEKLG